MKEYPPAMSGGTLFFASTGVLHTSTGALHASTGHFHVSTGPFFIQRAEYLGTLSVLSVCHAYRFSACT